MTKEDFIKFLETKATEAVFSSHFARTYTNSDDYWKWYIPAVDCLEDDIDLSVDNQVKFTYNKSLYDNESSIEEFFEYEEFIEKFYNTKRR